MNRRLLILPLIALLAGCDQLGIESATATAARREAEGKAVGAACRHAGRAIEDCFVLNRRTDKASIYAGWREMDDYMRENKMETVAPVLEPGATKHAEADTDAGADGREAKPAGPDKSDAPAERPGKAEKGSKAEKADKTARADAGDKADSKVAAHDGGADPAGRQSPTR